MDMKITATKADKTEKGSDTSPKDCVWCTSHQFNSSGLSWGPSNLSVRSYLDELMIKHLLVICVCLTVLWCGGFQFTHSLDNPVMQRYAMHWYHQLAQGQTYSTHGDGGQFTLLVTHWTLSSKVLLYCTTLFHDLILSDHFCVLSLHSHSHTFRANLWQ